MHYRAVFLLALAGSSFALAQDDSIPIADATIGAMPLVAQRPAAVYTPPAIKDNFQYGFNRVFSPGKLLLFGVKAAMDQKRDVPHIWGQGMQGYGSRYADRFGRALVRENVALGVRLLTGEDPRYEMCAVSQASGRAPSTP